jgi:hypothetical protein
MCPYLPWVARRGDLSQVPLSSHSASFAARIDFRSLQDHRLLKSAFCRFEKIWRELDIV